MVPKCYLALIVYIVKSKLKRKWREILLHTDYYYYFRFPSKSKSVQQRAQSHQILRKIRKYKEYTLFCIKLNYLLFCTFRSLRDFRQASAVSALYIYGSIQRTRCYAILDSRYEIHTYETTKYRYSKQTASVHIHYN